MSDEPEIMHENAAELTVNSLDFTKLMFAWAGTTKDGNCVSFALNASDGDDAMWRGMQIAVMNGHRATDFVGFEIAELLGVNDDGESGTA